MLTNHVYEMKSRIDKEVGNAVESYIDVLEDTVANALIDQWRENDPAATDIIPDVDYLVGDPEDEEGAAAHEYHTSEAARAIRRSLVAVARDLEILDKLEETFGKEEVSKYA